MSLTRSFFSIPVARTSKVARAWKGLLLHNFHFIYLSLVRWSWTACYNRWLKGTGEYSWEELGGLSTCISAICHRVPVGFPLEFKWYVNECPVLGTNIIPTLFPVWRTAICMANPFWFLPCFHSYFLGFPPLRCETNIRRSPRISLSSTLQVPFLTAVIFCQLFAMP